MKKIYLSLLCLLWGMSATLLQAQCPAISCPANSTVNNTPGSCAANVSYLTPVGTNPCGGSTTTTLNFTGAMQTFTVPANVTSITVDAQGSQGGGTLGGNGGRAIATIPVTPGEVLQVWVGGRPTLQVGPGGFNGGGDITIDPCGGNNAANSFPGGGASDVRRGSGYANRLIVGGGGGGQGWSNGAGGGGGGTTGVDGAPSWIAGTHGKGGSQVAGGIGGFYSGNGQAAPNGTLGVGGSGAPVNTYCTGGGGGGGYYGGGAGYVSAGGGGSSFASYPGNTATSTTAGFRAGNGVVTITYSGSGSANTALIAGPASGGSFAVGATNVTYQVTDGLGGASSCTFVVTVVDAQSPTISCPSTVTANTGTGTCSATVNYATPSGTDNCSTPTIGRTAGLASGSAFPIGNTTITHQATDQAGNTSSCSFLVTVIDAEAPTITCPASITISNDPGSCNAVATFTDPVGTDNCSGATTTRTTGAASGSVFSLGVNTQTYTVTDGAGNSATCSFTISVTDTENPTITCPTSFSVAASGPGCVAPVTYSPPVATDNCSGPSIQLTSGLGSGAVFPSGVTTESYTALDIFGNAASCSFTVTVNGATTGSQTLAICAGGSVTVGTHVYTTAGIYTDTLANALACDSILTTLLSVTTVNAATTVAGITISAVANGATYQWVDCDNGLAAIPGQTAQSFTPTQTGNYAVIVGENGCTDTSACTAVTVVGIASSFGSAFTLYPNPSTGLANVVFGQYFDALEIRVSDLSGKLLFHRDAVSGTSAQLDLREFSKGVYLVEVRSQDLRRVLRMVIQ